MCIMKNQCVPLNERGGLFLFTSTPKYFTRVLACLFTAYVRPLFPYPA